MNFETSQRVLLRVGCLGNLVLATVVSGLAVDCGPLGEDNLGPDGSQPQGSQVQMWSASRSGLSSAVADRTPPVPSIFRHPRTDESFGGR